MRWALALGILAVLGLSAGASAASVDLDLDPQFRMGNLTLALGHLDPGQPELSDLHAVDVRALEVPEGTLYVCPFEGGRQEEVPPIPVLQDRCRDEDAYEDPELRLGERTSLAFAGNIQLEKAAPASTTALLPAPETGSLRLASVTAGPMQAAVDDEMAFRPRSSSAQIAVEADGEEQTYNGTGWVFYLEGSGSTTLDARGVHMVVPASTPIELTPAGTASMREALDARTLLDLQSAALGPDAREPVENASRLLGQQTRLPPLVDGALLGYLDGAIGDRAFAPETVSLVGVSHLEGEIDGGNLTGEADVRFARTDAGIAPGLEAPGGPPLIAAGLAWALAGLSLALGPAPAIANLRHRLLGVASFTLALLAWDGIFASAFGASALSTAFGPGGLGVVFALAGFEVIAFGLAWLALALPAGIVARRWLVDRIAVYAGPVLTVALLAFAALRPGTIVALGRLVAQM